MEGDDFDIRNVLDWGAFLFSDVLILIVVAVRMKNTSHVSITVQFMISILRSQIINYLHTRLLS